MNIAGRRFIATGGASEVTRGTTATLLETFQTRPIRGEFTLVIAGCPT